MTNSNKTSTPARDNSAGYYLLLLLPLLILSAMLFYFSTNSSLQPFDDEGFFLSAMRSFAAGKQPYQDYFTLYGPVYQVYSWLVFTIFNLRYDSAGIRTASLLAALLSTGLLSAALFELTRRPVLTTAATVLIAHCLLDFGSIPGHPNECIIFLLSSAIFFIQPDRLPDKSLKLAGLFGLLGAAIFLCKFNVGIFIFAAALQYLAWRSDNGRISNSGFLLLITATALVPLAVVQRPGDSIPALQFLAVIEISYILTVAAAFRRKPGTALPYRTILAALTVFLAALFSVVGIMAAAGIPLATVYWGLFDQHRSIWTAYVLLPDPNGFIFFEVGASLLLFLIRDRLARKCSNVFGTEGKLALPLLNLGYGVGVLLLVFVDSRIHAFHFGIAFLWLPALFLSKDLACPGDPETSSGSPSSTPFFFIFLAMMLSLLMYPRMLTNLPLIPLTLSAAVVIDRSWRKLKPVPLVGRLNRQIGLFGLPVAALTFLGAINSVQIARTNFNGLTPLNLPGSGNLRVEKERAEITQKLIAKVKPDSGTLFTVPGLYSLNIWSELPPPSGFNFTNWILHFPATTQQNVIEALKKADRPIIIWNDALLKFWGITDPLPDAPLVNFIKSRFCQTGTVGDFAILRPEDSSPAAEPCKRIR